MKVLDTTLAEGFIRVCDNGFNQNWHERSDGNLSYRTRPEGVESMKEEPSYDRKWQPVGISASALSGECLMVSGSGRFMCNMILEPKTNCCIIEADRTGRSYCICWGLVKGGRLINELSAHLMDHEAETKVVEGRYGVIYRAHPANVIALTLVLPLTGEVLTRELWEMATGCPVVFPVGVGVVGWMVSGGRDTVVTTSRLIEEYDAAVWAYHGLLCAGEGSDLTSDLMHATEKSAETLVRVLSTHPDKLQTITPQEFRNLAVNFHVDLPEKLLYGK